MSLALVPYTILKLCHAAPKQTKSIHCNCSDCSLKKLPAPSQNQVFDPYHILGLEPGAPDSEIKKAYRKFSVLYHPDKNSGPGANKYFVEKIVKTYQALTDPVSHENYEKYGHPDGRQEFEMGIALPHFLLDTKTNGGILLLGIVSLGILLPLVIVSCCISLKGGKICRQLCHAPNVVPLTITL